MAYRLAYNPLDTPVVIDYRGRIIGGHDHGVADDNSPEARAAADDGLLLWVDVERGNDNDRDVVALADRAAEVERRRAALMAGKRGDLHRRARDRDLSSEQTDGQLAAELALDPTVEVTEPPEEPAQPEPRRPRERTA